MEDNKLGALPEFAATLLNAATTAHYMHLQARSYAQHMALGSFYAELPDLADAIVEACQGRYGIIEEYPDLEAMGGGDPVSFISYLKGYVEDTRHHLPQDSEIQNAIDDVATLIDSTLYKLRFLK